LRCGLVTRESVVGSFEIFSHINLVAVGFAVAYGILVDPFPTAESSPIAA
jgi:hypothetical protein